MAGELIVKNGLRVSGSTSISGSIIATSFTGSFSGSITSATSASYAATASSVNALSQSVLISGSLRALTVEPTNLSLNYFPKKSGTFLTSSVLNSNEDLDLNWGPPTITPTTPNSRGIIIYGLNYSQIILRVSGSTGNDGYMMQARPGGNFAFSNIANNTQIFTLGSDVAVTALSILGAGGSIGMGQSGGSVGINWPNIYTIPTKFYVSGSVRFDGATTINGTGTTSATTAFTVKNANASSSLVVRDDGRVGIGTSTPTNTFEVNGSATISGSIIQRGPGIYIYDINGYGGGRIFGGYGYLPGEIYIRPLGSNGDFIFSPNNGMSIGGFSIGGTAGSPPAYGLAVSGSVGIGTRLPTTQLDVSGSGRFTGNLTVTGSVVGTSFTGSLFGTASYATFALGTNTANTASFVQTAQTASFAPLYTLVSATSSMLAPYLLVANTSSFATTTQLNSYLLISNTASMIAPYLLVSNTGSMLSPYTPNSQTGSFIRNNQTSSFYTGSFTGSFIGTSSFASTASYVNSLNQNVLITGSLTIGSSSLGSNENTLTLGARDTANEGGQIGFNAPGGTYTSASFIDNWQNKHRILRGNNTTSDATVATWDLHTKQMQLPQYTNASSFPGTATANLAVDSNGNVLTVSTTGGTVFPYTGNAVITGSLTTTGIIYAQPNGGMYFQGGDDAALYDINISNHIGIYGVQDSTVGSIKLGSGGGIISGRSGSIGIGITTPISASLHVSGGIFSTSITSSFTGSFIGSLTGTASYANNADALDGFSSTAFVTNNVTGSMLAPYLLVANTSSFATTTQLNSYLLLSNTSSMLSPYLLVSNTSSFATTSQLNSYLLLSNTASMIAPYLLNSNTGSMLSPYTPNSQTGSFVRNNQTSSFVTNSQTSSFVQNSQTSSMLAPYLLVTNTSSLATTSQLASYLLISNTGSMLTPYTPNSQTGSFIRSNQTSSMLAPYLLVANTSSFATTSQLSSYLLINNTASMVAPYLLTARTSSLATTGSGTFSGSITISSSLGVGTAAPATVGLIRATNDVVAFYSSDERLKTNKQIISKPLEKLNQINGYEFDWIPTPGIHENEGHDIGVIAQEVEKILPEIVTTRDNGYKAVKYEKIVALLIEAVKDLQNQVNELKNGNSNF